ncbi:hypothetical protein [Exiguobacterium sp. s162]|uniref:hypothetical protein n=1 Tax=Exiguobacterium sp. s162 TaxID=2751276 RepID=UPI001BEB3E17|nr:hypothetical protein [Exiguobacterium sp. s162]
MNLIICFFVYTYTSILLFFNNFSDVIKSKLFSEIMVSSYISGGGSFLGGVVGGSVAYFVARHQIVYEKNKTESKERKNARNQIFMLSLELESHLEIFKLVIESKDDTLNSFKKSISLEVWNEVKYDLASYIPNDNFEELVFYYKDIKDLVHSDLPDYNSFTEDDILTRIRLVNSLLEKNSSISTNLR